MDITHLRKSGKKNIFTAIYAVGFLSAFHVFIIVYINSSFLNQYISEEFVGMLYIIGSLITISTLTIIPYILRRFGNYLTLVTFTLFEILIILGMAFIKEAMIVIPLFIAHWVIFQIIFINIDIFLETYQKKESDTGSTRGIFLTIINSSLIFSILIVGLILTNEDYWKIYLISAGVLLPFLFIIFTKFRNFKDPVYENFKIWRTFKKFKADRNISNIFMAQFILKFFFSWMVVYMPIYLHDYIGFNWQQIAAIFFIMLLPFILIEIPAGKIADRWIGEKELLLAGFIIMALSTMVIPFIGTASFILWTTILFVTRIGASLVEIMTESYFFKHVKGDDANIISFFRMTRPLAYIAGPIAAIIALQFFPFQYIFLVLGIIMFLGLKYSLALKDTL
ncbi:MAG: MFS transporter [Candidatus Pacebacteria bacterium]|jgi:predicted MFS family arabinose efflux permease|nr:MFS transporter [Candidatus Paceibacterota bacterium]|tara:strand:+ start:12812 stop:13993 length:1182 start_codon:yes stop_codon:yes gene_type:complete